VSLGMVVLTMHPRPSQGLGWRGFLQKTIKPLCRFGARANAVGAMAVILILHRVGHLCHLLGSIIEIGEQIPKIGLIGNRNKKRAAAEGECSPHVGISVSQ